MYICMYACMYICMYVCMCCGPGLLNIQYNSLLNLNYTNRTKTIAFADDLILITRGKTVREAENIANILMTKISAWGKANKIHFNEKIESYATIKKKT